MSFSKCVNLCGHHYIQFYSSPISPARSPAPITVESPCPRQPLISFLSLWICVSWTFHINGIIQCVVSCVWLISLSVMFWGPICVRGCISTLYAWQYSTVWTVHVLFISPPVGGHWGGSHFSAIVSDLFHLAWCFEAHPCRSMCQYSL